jgi:SAM-dependent methyltransferase
MDEASKTNRLRRPDFFSQYLSGRIIDIGCGEDPVVRGAEPFDIKHGDAQHITRFRPNAAYDCVHSSHCLEHMVDVPAALSEWWSLVRPGGYLVLVVPDKDLYEQGAWPSIFNADHKARFTLGDVSGFAYTYNIAQLIAELPDARIIGARLRDDGYDYRLQREHVSLWGRALFVLYYYAERILARLGASKASLQRLARALFYMGMPVDQTRFSAIAQIEVIAQKAAQRAISCQAV